MVVYRKNFIRILIQKQKEKNNMSKLYIYIYKIM